VDDAPENAPGGVGDAPGPADLNLIARAIRQDWPIPPEVKKKLLQNAINLADPAEGDKVSKRTRIAALRVIGAFGQLTVNQAKLDLAREKFEHERAKGEPNATGMAEVHERMAAYLDPDRSTGEGPGMVPPAT
jgi:hypothetical protein